MLAGLVVSNPVNKYRITCCRIRINEFTPVGWWLAGGKV
jgi:hypothetical protein